MSPWRSTARKGVKVTRSPKISFAAKARIASAPANSRWTSLTKASGSKVAIQASISWPLQAARWRAMAGGRSLVISLGMAGSIKFGERRCGSVVTPAPEPDLKGLASGPHVSEAKASIPSKRYSRCSYLLFVEPRLIGNLDVVSVRVADVCREVVGTPFGPKARFLD